MKTLGITAVDVVGDTRFDRVLQIKAAAKQLPIVERFVGSASQVFVAGSSWPPDEAIFLKYFEQHTEWKLIIAPHVIGEAHLASIEALLPHRKVVRYTQANETNVLDAEVLLIDCFGLLSSIYHYGTVSYVGGGFGVGIHNVLEAAVWGIPVIFGPNNQHFQEAQELKQAKGGFEITSEASFDALLSQFETDADYLRQAGDAAERYVASKAGAVENILGKIVF